MNALFETARPKANRLSDAERNALVLSCEGLYKSLAWEAAKAAGLLHELDDLVMDAALACVEASRAWEPGTSAKFSTYATTRIKRHLIKCVEDAKPGATAVRFANWDHVEDEAPADADGAVRLTPEEQTLLGRIDHADREAVRLVVCEGLTPDRVAEQLGVEVKDVKLRLRNAAKKLGAQKDWLARPGLFSLTDADE